MGGGGGGGESYGDKREGEGRSLWGWGTGGGGKPTGSYEDGTGGFRRQQRWLCGDKLGGGSYRAGGGGPAMNAIFIGGGGVSHLADVPCLDVLQLGQQLLIAASLQLLNEGPAVGGLRGGGRVTSNNPPPFPSPPPPISKPPPQGF